MVTQARVVDQEIESKSTFIEPITETLIWLRRLDGDPGHAWLRDSLRTHASRLMGSVVEFA